MTRMVSATSAGFVRRRREGTAGGKPVRLSRRYALEAGYLTEACIGLDTGARRRGRRR